ncbi:hypothetical protein [Salsuginibacillus kocurii]|uniref:hypothetical protein n=1 Tax=Salsuginibacillus kocurii TaxID=427078 RepID=UPI00037C3AA6|nr:hypothetical protein [Salsuginibacillus kocurii]
MIKKFLLTKIMFITALVLIGCNEETGAEYEEDFSENYEHPTPIINTSVFNENQDRNARTLDEQGNTFFYQETQDENNLLRISISEDLASDIEGVNTELIEETESFELHSVENNEGNLVTAEGTLENDDVYDVIIEFRANDDIYDQDDMIHIIIEDLISDIENEL